jgi:hypothetical protein
MSSPNNPFQPTPSALLNLHVEAVFLVPEAQRVRNFLAAHKERTSEKRRHPQEQHHR